MTLSFLPHPFQLDLGGVQLRGLTPLVDGRPLDSQPQVGGQPPTARLTWDAPGGARFILAAEPDGDGWALCYRLEDLPPGRLLDSFGLRFDAVENARQYLCSGYYSWDRSHYVALEGLEDFGPDEPRPETGYAFTQLLPRHGPGGLVIGFDRHDRFQQTFTFDTRRNPPSLTVETLWDRKDPGPENRAESERLLIFAQEDVEGGLREWALRVAQAAPTPPRLHQRPITGWCSWYNLYAQITEENLRDHLAGAAQTMPPGNAPRVFQIDDGFTLEMGDWLEVKPQFPGGMKPLLDDARRAGFIPGLWIAPFMVGNRSRLYRDHPDWVVRDRRSGGPLVQMEFYGEFRWHKRSEEYYILDATHPGAFAYLRQVFRAWRYDWGCEYFKIDFLHFGAAHGPDRAVWHTPGRTRIEIWRSVLAMICEETRGALLLGCGCPLWAAVGLLDAVRTGRDVGVDWHASLPAPLLFENLAIRSAANHILWQADPDCVLLRQRFHHLSDDELRAVALFAGMLGGVLTTSDHLGELSPERLALWNFVLSDRSQPAHFPFLGCSPITYRRLPAGLRDRQRHEETLEDPVFVALRPAGEGVVWMLVFNAGDTPAECVLDFEELSLPSPLWSYEWGSANAAGAPSARLELALNAHSARLLALCDHPLERLPEHL